MSAANKPCAGSISADSCAQKPKPDSYHGIISLSFYWIYCILQCLLIFSTLLPLLIFSCPLFRDMNCIKTWKAGSCCALHPAVWFHGLKNPVFQRHCCVFCKKEISYCTCCYLCNLWIIKKPWRRRILNLLSCWELDQVLVFPEPSFCSFGKCRSLQTGGFYSGSCEGLFTPPERYEMVPVAKMVMISWEAVLSGLCTCPVVAGMIPRADFALWKY